VQHQEVIGRAARLWLTALGCAVCWAAGSQAQQPAQPGNRGQPPALTRGDYAAPDLPARLATPVAVEPSPLASLLALASQQNPDLAAARARVEAARGKMVQAGLYPNPTINWHGDEMNAPGGRSGHQGMTVSQEFVMAHKLRLAREAAAAGVAAFDWQATTRWFDVVTRVRLAYVELLAARREVQAQEENVRIAEEGHATALRLAKAGVAAQPDVLRAEVALDQSRALLDVSRQRLDAAQRLLAAAVGVPALPALPPDDELERPVPGYEWEPTLETVLARSSEVQEARSLADQAARLLRKAEADRFPNVFVTFRPFYAQQDHTTEFLGEVGTALPLYNRNQGNILTARADVARTRQDIRVVELRLTERLAGAFRRYEASARQAGVYRRQILPRAAESLRLVRIGYERGDPKYDYTAVLDAQRTLVQSRLAYVQVLAELWRATAEIEGLLQREDPSMACGAP
jgi:cobalt-zinc-cadmium efflux system outer membrane protein